MSTIRTCDKINTVNIQIKWFFYALWFDISEFDRNPTPQKTQFGFILSHQPQKKRYGEHYNKLNKVCMISDNLSVLEVISLVLGL